MNNVIQKIHEINQHIDIISGEVKELGESRKKEINNIVQEVDALLNSIRKKIAKLQLNEH